MSDNDVLYYVDVKTKVFEALRKMRAHVCTVHAMQLDIYLYVLYMYNWINTKNIWWALVEDEAKVLYVAN